MTAYQVWSADSTEEDGASTIEAGDPAEAAEKFAREDCDEGYYDHGAEVHVRTPRGSLVVVSVTVEFEPSFFSHVVREELPGPGSASRPPLGVGK